MSSPPTEVTFTLLPRYGIHNTREALENQPIEGEGVHRAVKDAHHRRSSQHARQACIQAGTGQVGFDLFSIGGNAQPLLLSKITPLLRQRR